MDRRAVLDEGQPAPLDWRAPSSAAANWGSRRRQSLVVTALIGPMALVAVLALRHFGLVAKEPVWAWIVILTVLPVVSVLSESLDSGPSSRLRIHARVAWHAAVVTTVIYLTGWGPVLVGAFAFATLQTVAHDGSKAWRVSAAWSVIGVAVGQLFILERWAPSFLADSEAQALGLMGAFVLMFMIRMAGATMAQKEEAEASMRASENRYRSLVQHSSDLTLVLGQDDLISYASPATVKLLGRTPEQVVGMADTELLHPEDREQMTREIGPILEHSTSATEPMSVRLAHADGSWRDVEVVITNLCQEPSVEGYVCNIRDISERKQAEALLVYQALHDPLTGLPNRTVILDRAEQMLARARRIGQPVAALFIDLDNFKDINDTLGHETGDSILCAVADRFRATVRDSDTVGRFGGDEFVVLTEGATVPAGPEALAERLRRALEAPFFLPGLEDIPLSMSASIGIASGVRPTATGLLRDADTALYRAKASGKDCCAEFEPAMKAAILDRIELKRDLTLALEDNQFFVLYQPLFDLETLHVCGVEALLRWQHPTRGTVAPDEFISTLEETGRIHDVGGWVLTEACAKGARWRRDHDISVSVNVSARQVDTDLFLGQVDAALRATGLPPEALILEITETALMRDAEAAVGRLETLKRLGVRISIDDFGTGYSSLAYLRRFPVDEVKLDRSFVSSMAESSESAAIVHTLVELSNTLGLTTVAEGIEDRQQLESLRREGCHRGQGYFLAQPAAPAVVDEILVRGLVRPDHDSTRPSIEVGDRR
jgi:diguanylate cyclase (GGDEF)-like protein/PAS domain S-box-containing protein